MKTPCVQIGDTKFVEAKTQAKLERLWRKVVAKEVAPTRAYADALVWGANRFGERVTAEYHSSGHTAFSVGKKRAGAELDGRAWREFPRVGA